MIKKIIVGGLLAIVFGLLILGAINRTLAKSNGSEPLALIKRVSGGYGSGQGDVSASHGQEQDSTLAGRDANDTGDQQGGNNSGDAYDSGQGGGGIGVGRASVDAWSIKTGLVKSVSADVWVVALADGTDLELEGRMLGFLVEQGFSVNQGDTLILTVFMDGDKVEVGQIQNTTTDKEIRVRDENGRPMWSGSRWGGTGE